MKRAGHTAPHPPLRGTLSPLRGARGVIPLTFLLLALLATAAPAQTTRIASDFELHQMEQQVAQAKDFVSQISGRLNLGDVHLLRNEGTAARAEYQKALEVASEERIAARTASQLTRYATATSYAALAAAKLGDEGNAFALSEEAIRYSSDSDKTWNLYANAMQLLHRPAKAVSAARNAVATADDPLDLAVDQYTLASALLDLRQDTEAQALLESVVRSLRSDEFASLRREIVRHESFEIYSTARGEAAAYISLLDRAQLRLGRLYEDHGRTDLARQQYRNVLAGRSDDPTALAAMARLATAPQERERWYAQAFDANPFSLPLIRDYQQFLRAAQVPPPAEKTPGAQVRLALQQMEANELPAAIATITIVEQKFPDNDTLAGLRREIEDRRAGGSGIRAILASFVEHRITPEERARLDVTTFTGTATFTDAQSGTVDGVPFRLSQPANVQGSVRLQYRILGATELNGADALLIEVAP